MIFFQHDAQEFLALFLDTMHQQMNLKETDNNIQYDSDIDDDYDKSGDEKCQLNNSMSSKSLSGVNSSEKVNCDLVEGISIGTRNSESEQMDEDSNVSFVIQSELPTLLKSVVRTNSESDLQSLIPESNELEPLLNNASNLKQKIPKIEEFYAKDTKTLNTNVVVTDFNEEALTTDSEKFHKQENNLVETNDLSLLAEAVPMATESVKDDSPRKGVKDVNIQADKSKKLSKSVDSDSDNENSIKKMKFECAEKNFQYQALSKIKKDFDLTEQNLSLASLGEEGVRLIKDLGILGSLDKDLCETMMQKSHMINSSKGLGADHSEKVQEVSEDLCGKVADSSVAMTEGCAGKSAKTKQIEDPEGCSQASKKIRKGSPSNDEGDEQSHGASNGEWSDTAGTDGSLVRATREITEAEEEAADRAWEAYVKDNHSVIVSTFQGQFKSTVSSFNINVSSIH